MNFTKKIQQFFTGKKEDILTPAGDLKAPMQPPGRPMPIRMRRRRTKRGPKFTDIRMERGVQMAKERAQRPARLAAIYDSMRQGVEVAKARRLAYVKRRTARWRALTEATLPRMFAQAMEKMGMGLEVGSGAQFKGELGATNSRLPNLTINSDNESIRLIPA